MATRLVHLPYESLLAILIFVITLVFVIWQPRGLSIGWTAAGGALLALACRVVNVSDVRTVASIVWDATLAFVAIVLISVILDEIGFFEWGALKMAHAAKGNGRKVFLYVLALGALVSAFFTNDGAALILTPIVLEKVRLLKFDAKKTLAFVLASGFIADTTSIPFTVSNLVNIVSADFFGIRFVRYVTDMVIPDVVSFIASVAVLFLFFHRDIPRTYPVDVLPSPRHAIRHAGMFRMSWIIIFLLFIGYLLSEPFHIPVSAIAGTAALLLLACGVATRSIRPWRSVREAPWAVVVFSVGMYVVVYGLHNTGVVSLLANLLDASAQQGNYLGTLATGFLAAALSSTMNNLPSVMINSLAIHVAQLSTAFHHVYVYANVVGCDLGPKITPIGSLATLLWLHILRRKGITITWWQYFRTGVILTVPTLFVTLTGLYLWLRV